MQVKQKIGILRATIGPEGQITLPEEALQALSLKPGGQVRFFISKGEISILPVRTLKQLFGSLKYDGPPISLEQMDEDIAKAACDSAGARY